MGDDRFGVPDSAFRAAAENHGRDNPVRRIGMYVPPRQEVATLAPDDLAAVLDLGMWESPAEIIPSHDQIRQVRSILASRPDAETPAIQAIIAECELYLGHIECQAAGSPKINTPSAVAIDIPSFNTPAIDIRDINTSPIDLGRPKTRRATSRATGQLGRWRSTQR